MSVNLTDLLYAEVYDRKLVLHMRNGTLTESYGRLAELERKAGDGFYRIHRSYLINLSYVKAYHSKEVDVCGEKIPVARGKYQAFVKAYLAHQLRQEGL